MSGIPGLSDIPVLGWLFKYETKQKETREILIFITPKIIKDRP
jgi:type IV pilus assembly protein PilQ